ncbi:VHL domain-containing protein, partial [Haematococcus lacustris]
MAQPLAAATSTRPMRIRSPTELEPAVYPVVSSSPRSSVSLVRAKEVLSDVQQVRLRSVSSVVECIIEFVNTSDVSVWAVWLDFAGNEVQYTMIEAKGKRRYRTFQSHPWIVRAVHNGQRMMLDRRMVVIGRGGEQSVKITTPPQ